MAMAILGKQKARNLGQTHTVSAFELAAFMNDSLAKIRNNKINMAYHLFQIPIIVKKKLI
jgi:hypothetical protein